MTSADEPTAAILAHLPLGVWVARAPSGQVVYVNPAFQRILGMDAVPGRTIDEAPATYGIHDRAGRLYPIDRLPFSRVLSSGGPVTVDDLVIHRKDGARVAVRAFGAPLRNAAGEIALVIVAFADITAEVSAIADRKKAQDRLAFAVHNAPVVLFGLDAQGTVTLSEGKALAALGFRSGELVGRSAHELYRDNPVVLGDMRRALAGEEIHHVVQVGETALESYLTPVRDESGRVVEVIGMSTDVTAQRKLQARVIQGDRIAAMGTLAASVAHEINNPLTSVLGNLMAAEADIDDAVAAVDRLRIPEELASIRAPLLRMRAALGDARTGGERIARIARDLHTFARPRDEVVRPLALAAVVRSVLQLVRKEIEARARLIVELADTPPVSGEESPLVQVILNLLVNAWQALPDADPSRHEIALRTSATASHVVVEVSDTGPGVPAEDRERIFEPFFTTKGVGVGTGLGLFVCRNIVDSMGGKLEVADRPGGGALFRVTFPVGPASPAAAPSPARAAPALVKRGRVLIIDDEEDVARILAKSLRREFDAEAVFDGRQALDRLLADPSIDLAFCDLMMNGLTGMDLHAALTARAPEQASKLVFMTGGAYTPQAAAFLSGRTEAVVYKPFDVLEEARRRLTPPGAAGPAPR